MKTKMKPFTVRNLPPVVAGALQDKAKRERLSLNRAVAELLAEAMGLARRPKKPVRHHDLDRFAGVWDAYEADAFDEALAEGRSVRLEDWK